MNKTFKKLKSEIEEAAGIEVNCSVWPYEGVTDWMYIENVPPVTSKLNGARYRIHDAKDNIHGRFQAGYPADTISNWSLVSMPGCCGCCISTGVYVVEHFQKKGLGTLLNRLRIDIARALGFGLLFCTDVVENDAQQKILTKNKWDFIYEFKNPRTNNQIGLHVIKL